MTLPKLYYYKATGLAHHIRLAMSAGGMDWEDVFAGGFPPTDEDKILWQKLGGNSTTNIPMLEMPDGKTYTQSSAVLRVVARMCDLFPTGGDDELYLTDKLLADATDFKEGAYKSFVPWGATPEAAESFMNEVVPLHFGNMERILTESGTNFFIGDKLTVADISIYDAVENFACSRIPGDILENFPKLKEFKSRVEENSGIAAYLASEKFQGISKFDKSTLGL